MPDARGVTCYVELSCFLGLLLLTPVPFVQTCTHEHASFGKK
jgi:hypothetical protein